MAGIRFILAGALLIPFWITRVQHPFRQLYRNRWKIMLVSLLQTTLLYGMFNFGIKLVPSSIAAIVTGCSPLIMALVSHAATKDDKLSWRKLICLFIALFGIIIIAIYRKPWHDGGIWELAGIGLLLSASISGAFGNLAVRTLRIDPFMLNSVQIFTGGVVLFLAGLIFEDTPNTALPLTFYLGLSWLAVLSATAFSIWFYLLHQPGVKPSALSMWKFVIPVFGAVFSWIIFQNENPEFGAVVGMICVAGSLFFYFEPLQKNAKQN